MEKWRKNVPGGTESTCKGPEEERAWGYSGQSEKALWLERRGRGGWAGALGSRGGAFTPKQREWKFFQHAVGMCWGALSSTLWPAT